VRSADDSPSTPCKHERIQRTQTRASNEVQNNGARRGLTSRHRPERELRLVTVEVNGILPQRRLITAPSGRGKKVFGDPFWLLGCHGQRHAGLTLHEGIKSTFPKGRHSKRVIIMLDAGCGYSGEWRLAGAHHQVVP